MMTAVINAFCRKVILPHSTDFTLDLLIQTSVLRCVSCPCLSSSCSWQPLGPSRLPSLPYRHSIVSGDCN